MTHARRLIALLLALTGLAAAGGSPASAAYYTGCVTRTEYRRVHTGNSMRYAHRVLGTSGRSFFTYNGYYSDLMDREYRVCGSWGWVFIDFERDGGSWYVTDKTAYWG